MRTCQSLPLIIALLLGAGAASGEAPPEATFGGSFAADRPQEFPDVRQFAALPDMVTRRSSHTATLLADGRVFICGGMERNGRFLSSAELYDPAKGRFTETRRTMGTARVGHTATLLPNGKVLIAGGWSREGVLSSAEVYDAATDTFESAGRMATARGDFSASLLPDGKVLIAGGQNTAALASAEVYDPVAGTFTPTASMQTARTMHAASTLRDGSVLITGGGEYRHPVRDAEIYDPATGRFSRVGAMAIPRYKHATVVLPNGNVLVVGGSDGTDWQGRYASTEIYSVATKAFASAGSMHSARFKLPHTVLLLRSGKVLIAGGGNTLETFAPATHSFSELAPRLDAERFYATSTLLANGSVLIAGGYDTKGEATAKSWLLTP